MNVEELIPIIERYKNKPLYDFSDKELISCEIIKRENRFVVSVKIEDKIELAHINNTGKLKQWLIKGSKGLCYKINGKRLKYRLFYVENKNGQVIIDTNLHMKTFENILINSGIQFRRNPKFYGQVFDYLINNKIVVEIKSATLLNGEFVEYPDTYTMRGEKQIFTLANLKQEGNYIPLIIIITGVKDASKFRFNTIYGRIIQDAIIANNVLVFGYSIFLKDSSIYLGKMLKIYL